jgi:hypothetical protein
VAEAVAAFRDGHALASLEVEGVVEAASPWVGTTSPRLAVAFPRYRVYLFNTSERTVAARVYAYLSS